jgi:hypothetical protein
MADRDDLTDSFLALVDDASRRLLDEPGAHLHVTGFGVYRHLLSPVVGSGVTAMDEMLRRDGS